MNTIEQVILERLEADPAVAEALGGRLYLHRRAQSTGYPCARVSLVDQSDTYHLRGESNAIRARVQVDVWAEDAGPEDPYARAAAAAAHVNAAISGQRWAGGGSPGLEVTGAMREGRRALYDPDELRLVRISQDFAVWFRVS